MERVGADVPELAWMRGIGEIIWLKRTLQSQPMGLAGGCKLLDFCSEVVPDGWGARLERVLVRRNPNGVTSYLVYEVVWYFCFWFFYSSYRRI